MGMQFKRAPNKLQIILITDAVDDENVHFAS